MATLNKKDSRHTHEGAKAYSINPELQLRRTVCACLLWEDSFYEDGQSVADRIAQTIPLVAPEKVAALAIEAREKFKLRHAPLLLAREMLRHEKHRGFVANMLERIIQRPDELTEFLAIYWKDGRQPLAAQAKKGLAQAFSKFNEYQLAKYNRDGQVKLRDVLFLCHAKPADKEQEALWKRLIDGELATPDTWEVALSGGADKKATWERLVTENKLGALALLRNLRNMESVNVERQLIRNALAEMKVDRVLPFRFISAAKAVVNYEPELEQVLFKCLSEKTKIIGETIILVDVSGSMDDRLSSKSDVNRMDAACGVAMIAREIFDHIRVFTFSNMLVEVPPRRGFALRDAIISSQRHGETNLGGAVENVPKCDRLIVITDEQSHTNVPEPHCRGYVINVASYQNGIGYGPWTHIDGFSEAVLDYIREYEAM